jgi:pimeloyl-ACP methyl ester carboxylesterase
LKEESVNRRDLLQFAGAATAGLGLLANDPEGVQGSSKHEASSKTRTAMPFIETGDGATLFYKEWGTGKPMLFVHSWSVNTHLWQYQMVDLSSRGFRCIAYDQRGHGRSNDPGRGFDYDTLADDLHHVIETLGLRDVVLVGHSMGCGEIVRYATRHGASRISRVVLVAPTMPFALKTPDNPDGISRENFERLRAAWKTDLPKWLEDNARPFFSPQTSQAMLTWAVQMGQQASLKALIDCNVATTETDFRAELPKFNVPTLIIHGDADVSAPINFTGRRTANLIPQCQLKVYPGAPHGLMFTHAEQLNADLLSFCNGNNPSA